MKYGFEVSCHNCEKVPINLLIIFSQVSEFHSHFASCFYQKFIANKVKTKSSMFNLEFMSLMTLISTAKTNNRSSIQGSKLTNIGRQSSLLSSLTLHVKLRLVLNPVKCIILLYKVQTAR